MEMLIIWKSASLLMRTTFHTRNYWNLQTSYCKSQFEKKIRLIKKDSTCPELKVYVLELVASFREVVLKAA